MRRMLIFGCAAMLAGCVRASTIPLSQDTFQITARAAPICGSIGAEQMAFRQAAVETIRRGADRFIIVGGQRSAEQVGTTPMVAQSMGGGTVMVTGGDAMVSHGQGLVVKTFKEGDPAAANAISARDTLGPRWPELVQKQTLTCFDN